MRSLRPQEQHHEQLYKVFPICKSLSISVLVVEKCILWQLDYLERPGKNLPPIAKTKNQGGRTVQWALKPW